MNPATSGYCAATPANTASHASTVDSSVIRSGAITDDAGTTPALVIRVEDPELLPERPYGAVVDANEIRLYSDEWERSAQDVAATLSLRVTRERGTGEVPQT